MLTRGVLLHLRGQEDGSRPPPPGHGRGMTTSPPTSRPPPTPPLYLKCTLCVKVPQQEAVFKDAVFREPCGIEIGWDCTD